MHTFKLSDSTYSLALFAKDHNSLTAIANVKRRVLDELKPQLVKPEPSEPTWY
jgi:hypothetical protein